LAETHKHYAEKKSAGTNLRDRCEATFAAPAKSITHA